MNTIQIKTDSEIKAMGGKALVEFYNDIAEALGQEPVRRFADNPTGHKRTIKLMAEYKAKFPPAVVPAAAAKKSPAKKADGETKPNRRRGTNIIPFGWEPLPCREGSKQSILVDLLSRKTGATMSELLDGLSGGNKPWQEITVRAGFGWDLKNKGYGVRSEFDADGTERFYLVLPEKFPRIPAHTPLKTAKPKARAKQTRI